MDDTSDSTSYDEFFRREYPKLVSFLRKSGYKQYDAEDAAEEAMILLHGSWSTIASPGAWVRKVAYRIACKAAKRAHKEAERAINSELLDIIYHDRDIEMREERDQIIRLLNKLPPAQRLVMTWHLDGFSNKEISNQLGMSEVTVRSTLRHAREKMKKAFPGPQYAASGEGTE